LPSILEEDENQLSTLSRSLFAEQYQALVAMDAAIKVVDRKIEALCWQNVLSKRLVAIPGIGPLTTTLAAADVDDGKGVYVQSRLRRQLGRGAQAAQQWRPASLARHLPKGHKSKRGNRRLRTLLIHGARTVLKYCGDKSDPLSRWLQALIERRGFNKAAVAVANKNARIIWALATDSGEYVAQVA
jgi:transposase